MKKTLVIILAVFAGGLAQPATMDQLIADRGAIERVYYSHRINVTEPFEQAVPATVLRQLVERNLAREEALHTRYSVNISSDQITAEIARIDRSTRAPDVLAEIKAALGNDLGRYAESFVKPIVVERELRNRFANDDEAHASVRRECELVRTNLLAARAAGASSATLMAQLTQSHPNNVLKTTWLLAPRLKGAPAAKPGDPVYFDDLQPELRRVLAAQLRAAGDVSAIIETPDTFLLFVTEAKDEKQLVAASLSLPKLDCDTWLATQNPPLERFKK